MNILFLSLILVPIIAYLVTQTLCPRFRWAVTGITFGSIASPFFIGLSVLLIFAGFSFGRISAEVMLFHRSPGQELVRVIVEHRRLIGIENFWAYALNAINWGIVYGLIGWFVDRDPTRERTKVPLLLLTIPALIYIFPLYKASNEAETWKRNNPSGTVCFQLMDEEPNTKIWRDIGTLPKIKLTRFGGIPLGSEQHCSNFGLSLSPLTIQVYSATATNKHKRRATSEDNPSKPLTLSILAGVKRCVGIYPDNSVSPNGWRTEITNCASTNKSVEAH